MLDGYTPKFQEMLESKNSYYYEHHLHNLLISCSKNGICENYAILQKKWRSKKLSKVQSTNIPQYEIVTKTSIYPGRELL